MNSYMVDLSPLEAEHEEGNYGGNVHAIDALLSEGVVVHIAGLGSLTRCQASDETFVEVEIPIDESLLFLDNPDFLTQQAYNEPPCERSERIFLEVADVRASPDPAQVRAPHGLPRIVSIKSRRYERS